MMRSNMDIPVIKTIKKRLEEEAARYTSSLEQYFPPVRGREFMVNMLREHIISGGKRLRPILFVLSYMGYTKKGINETIYRGALGMEMMHLFALIHDDIIDKTDERRGKPSLHKLFETRIHNQKYEYARGEDYALVGGDILYSFALVCFMSMDIKADLKSDAMLYLLQTALRTGSGEIMELYNAGRDFDTMKRQELLDLYEYKSSWYTFICPLVLGAMLAETNQKELSSLKKYGLYMGYAFQLKDDLLDMLGKHEAKGRRPFDDIRGKKKNLLLWHAYQAAVEEDRQFLQDAFRFSELTLQQCLAVQQIYRKTKTFEFAWNEICASIEKARKYLPELEMDGDIKKALEGFCEMILNVKQLKALCSM